MLAGLPKDNPRCPPTPPPAYFPRQLPSIPHAAWDRNYHFYNNENRNSHPNSTHVNPEANPHMAARFAGINMPFPQQHVMDVRSPDEWAALRARHGLLGDEDDEDDNEDEQDQHPASSAITIRVSTAVKVHGEGNIVCLGSEDEAGLSSAQRALAARMVADAVVGAITSRDGGGAAVPMIDEEGRPRPLKVEIEAGVQVRGRDNVLGGREVVALALGRKRRRGDGGDVAWAGWASRRSAVRRRVSRERSARSVSV